MSTVLETKMREAGIALPSRMQRIWTWLRDNPGHTVRDVDAAMKFDNRNTTSSLISQMITRNMLLTVKEFRRSVGREINVVSVNPAMRGIYELLPDKAKPRRPKAGRPPKGVPYRPQHGESYRPEVIAAEQAEQVTVLAGSLEKAAEMLLTDVESVSDFVTSLPVRRAREIYDELDRIFSPKNL